MRELKGKTLPLLPQLNQVLDFLENLKIEMVRASIKAFSYPSILHILIYLTEPLSTVGVDLGMWKYRKDLEPSYRGRKGSTPLRSVTFYTWDFGGQVITPIINLIN